MSWFSVEFMIKEKQNDALYEAEINRMISSFASAEKEIDSVNKRPIYAYVLDKMKGALSDIFSRSRSTKDCKCCIDCSQLIKSGKEMLL